MLAKLKRHKTLAKPRKWKPFNKMNQEEKSERIKYLWHKVRLHVKTLGTIRSVQKTVDNKFLDEFAQDSKYDLNTALNTNIFGDDDELPRFLFYPSYSLVQGFRLILGLLLFF